MGYLYNLAGAGGIELIGTNEYDTAVLDITHTSTTNPAARIRSASAAGQALTVGRTVAASPTVAVMNFAHVSAASAPIFEFAAGGGFVSVTSVVLTTVANIKGAVRVKVGNVYYWIPLVLDAGLVGTGAF